MTDFKTDEPDYIYCNLSLFNDTLQNARAQLSNTLQAPLINPDKYVGSIIRFTLDANWPLFIANIPNPAFPLQTNMSISFSFGASFFQSFVSVTVDEVKNGVFDISLFLNDLNAASAASFTALKIAFPGAPGAFAPYFALNPATELISMYVDSGWLDTTAPTPNLIWFNSYLQDVLGLPANLRRPPPQPNGADYQIAVKDYASLLPIPPRTGFPYAIRALAGDWLQVSQEFVQLSEFSDIATIEFNTNMIPVLGETIPLNPGVSQSGVVQANTTQIVTDFIISRSDAKPRDNSFTYLPTAEYRRFTLRGNIPLRVLDLQANFTTFDGKIFPLFLPPGGSMTAKLMFQKK